MAKKDIVVEEAPIVEEEIVPATNEKPMVDFGDGFDQAVNISQR
jgi:hypothetical protein